MKLDQPKNELHIFTDLQKAQIMALLPDRVSRTRFINNYHLEPMPETPKYILLPNLPLFEAINERLLDKHDQDGYETIPIDKSIRSFVNSTEFDADLKIGQYSATDRKNKVRYVTQIPYTITECAREYIRLCEFLSGNKLKPKYNKHKDRVRSTPTHFFSGYYEGELAYIDLRAAYWQILWPTSIDMEYDPIKQEIAGDGTIGYYHCDQFAKSKPIRQIVHSLYNYRTMRTWKWDERRIRHTFPKSELYRPYNVAYIYDVMNAFVTDVAEHFTLLQWLTDAAIVPADQAEPLMEFALEEWFFDSRLVCSGPGISNQINMYKVGTKQTAHFDPKIRGVVHKQLRPANIEGLKILRQQAKKGELPPLHKSKRKPKMFGIAKSVIQESEYKPKKRLIAPKRESNPMNRKRKSPPPTNTIDATEFYEQWRKSEQHRHDV